MKIEGQDLISRPGKREAVHRDFVIWWVSSLCCGEQMSSNQRFGSRRATKQLRVSTRYFVTRCTTSLHSRGACPERQLSRRRVFQACHWIAATNSSGNGRWFHLIMLQPYSLRQTNSLSTCFYSRYQNKEHNHHLQSTTPDQSAIGAGLWIAIPVISSI